VQWPPSKWSQKVTLVLFSIMSCLLFSLGASAQVKVTGTVTDTTGEALTGVAVRIKGTQGGSTTDVKGQFSLTVPDANSVLVLSYIGFTTLEVPLNGQTAVRIRLKSSNASLQEIVVTGYGTQKKESITGAISTVTSKDLDRVHAGSTVSTGLAGKIPGVTFRMSEGRPGASASIQIRNMGSPLYVKHFRVERRICSYLRCSCGKRRGGGNY
jgi:hypothetical protein